MGAYCSKIKSNFDPDNVFSYKTIKLVVIKDKRLGIIHHVLQFAIFIYIVIYTILYQQRFLLLEAPHGSVRATLQEPNNWIDAATLPYCLQNQPSYNGFSNQECAYFLGTDLTYPPGMDSILIATRLKDTVYNISANGQECNFTSRNPPTSIACAPSKTVAQSQRYYTAGIENYTVFMEHAIFGRQNELVLSNTDVEGKLKFPKGSDMKPVVFSDKNRIGDILPLSTMLQAAGIKSLDDSSGMEGTYRYDGVMAVVVITYTNGITDPSVLHYEYELFAIPNQDVLAKEPTQLTEEGLKQRNWYGVRFVFMVIGSIGYFDFPTLLTSLVNGTVLLKMASIIVDILILYVMPDKGAYSQHKFETTEKFAKIREEKGKLKSQPSGNVPLLSNDYGALDNLNEHGKLIP